MPQTPEDLIQKHFEKLKHLLNLEDQEEIEQYRQEFLKRTPEERELAGMALLRLKITEFHFSPAGHRLVSFTYLNDKPLPLYSPDPGNMVTLSSDPHELDDLPMGTVYEKTKDTITVAFNRDLPDWAFEETPFHLNIAGHRASSKKMLDALARAAAAEHDRTAFFRDVSLGIKKAESYDPLPMEKITFFNQNLNEWQKKAVQMGLAMRDVALVHGPPGTGKTTALIEIIRQVVAAGGKVLAAAPSNTACDHLLEQLVKAKVAALRLGHPARIMKNLRQHTLDFKLAHHPFAKLIDDRESELERLQTQRGRRRGGGRAMDRLDREDMNERIHMLKLEIRDMDKQIFTHVMENAPVIVGTHTAASDPMIRSKTFDLVVMDEASQATEPSSWMPIQRGQKIILAGDHFQLPPTVISKKAEDQGLTKTIFERLHRMLPEENKTLLRIQYRMHEKIMNFSSKEFYDGKLVADASVKSHTLADLEHVKRIPETEEVFLFLDTAGRGFEEKLEPGSESRYNAEEAALVMTHLAKLLQAGVKPSEIAIISPYSAQVRLLASLVGNLTPNQTPDEDVVEVDSVDGFQGREKEAVILSLVRSNTEGELGFLGDTRRMNVAMTRARRKLVMIGDSATIGTLDFYKDFIQYSESIGGYRSSWEEV